MDKTNSKNIIDNQTKSINDLREQNNEILDEIDRKSKVASIMREEYVSNEIIIKQVNKN